MKASRLPSGSYRIYLYIGKDPITGKCIRKSITHKDKRTCQKLAAEYLDQHGGLKNSTSILSSMMEYVAVKERSLSPSTIKSYYGIVRGFENGFPDFCSLDISEVSSKDVQKIVDVLRQEKKATPKTIRNKMGFISAVCRYKNVKMPEVVGPQKERTVYHIPESRHVKKMLKYSAEEDSELWICIMLAATGPLREGEISALTMEDIDFKKNLIHVCHSKAINKNNEWVKKVPKTYGSDRFLTMPSELIAKIKEQGYVTNWTPRQIYEHFKKLLKTHRIPDCRFHDLRHYCVSELKAQGFPDVYIAARTGHTNLSTLHNIYTHALQGHQKKIDKDIIKFFKKNLP